MLLAVSLLPVLVTRAAAQDAQEPIRLAYRASNGCPDEASFVGRIRARTGRARIAHAGEAARTFTVVIEAGRPSSGRVIVNGADQAEATRSVQADSCSDVADALALVVALAIEPPTNVQPPPIASSVAPPSSASAAPRVIPPASEPGGFFIGFDVAVATGVAPRAPLIGGSPFLGWRAKGNALIEPSFRLAFLRAGSGPVDFTVGTAEFTWTVGRLDACPLAWPRAAIRVVECARVEAGTLEVAAANVPAPLTQLRSWLTAGPLVRAEWAFLHWGFIELEAGVLVRIVQDRFYFFAPETSAYQVPPVGVTAGVGVGIHFF
jgi:hypothetical protein